MHRTFFLLFAFLIGAFIPWFSNLKVLLSSFIIYMLIPVFLRLELTAETFTRKHLAIVGANLTFPFLVWWLVGLITGCNDLALCGFFIAVAPTATGAAVVMGLIGGNVSFTVTGFVLTNLAVSALLPLALPLITTGVEVGPLVWEVFIRVVIVTIVPAVIALALTLWLGRKHAIRLGERLSPSTFYVWILIVIVVASISVGLMHDPANGITPLDAIHVGILSLILAVIMFTLGYLIGWPIYPRECSQLLGQKNTSYAIYIAIALNNPIVVLGPALYVFFHNTWNGIQIALADRRRIRRLAAQQIRLDDNKTT